MVSQLVQDRTPNEELSKHFRKYDLIKMDPAAAAAQVRRNGRLVLKSSVRDFDLQVAPHDMRSPDYSAQVIDSRGVAHPLPKLEVTTYKGNVKGLAGAQARMSLTERGIEGAILTKQGRYFLQPAQVLSKSAGTDEFVLYESADLHKHDGTCGVTLADEVAAQEGVVKPASTDVIEAEVSGPVNSLTSQKIVRISTDADGEYVAASGGASQANTQIGTILNFVEGIYESEIGVTFQIVQQNAWADAASDPYTSTAPSTRLQQFRDHWNANFPNSGANTRAIAHLFTGVDLDGNTIGIANFAVTCRNPNFSYGLSQRFPSSGSITAQTVVLTAHEIGHNFAASHTNQESSDVPFDIERPCEGTIMEANVGTGSAFCPFSRSQIAGHANGFSSCLIDTSAPSPTLQDCPVTPLGGSSANGSLGAGDCRSPSRGVEHFADRYSFSGNAGQRLSITLNTTSGLDPYLFLIGPDGYVVAQDDDGNGSVNSRIPTSGTSFTLPDTGTYILEVTSFSRLETGSYTLTLNSTGCTLSATPSGTHFPSGGGSLTVNVTLSNCGSDSGYSFRVFPSTESWLTPDLTTAVGNQSLNFSVAANSNTAGRRAFLIVGGVSTGGGPVDVAGGIKIPITQSGTGPDCTATPIAFGQTLNGTLSAGDCHSPVRGDGFEADRYTFTASAGQRVVITTSAPIGAPDTFLTLLGPNGVVLLTDDDSGGGTNSRIPGGNRSLTLGLPGTYTIEVTPFDSAGNLGSYSLTLTSDTPVADTVQFSQSSFNVNEGAGTLDINVTRGPNSSAATVNFATTDNFAVQCNQVNGQASARCDFNTKGGTLSFAAGETSKTITLSIVNDGFVEGSETFTMTLSNAVGMNLGGPATSTITITDNDGAPTNPFENNAFFVRQQYLDFLFREPDTAGFNDWMNVLTNCPPNQGGLGSDPACDRVHVSSGFFRSTEFGERGYWAYRFYHGTLGRRPNFAEFVPDMRRLSVSSAEEETARAAFIADFMQRAEFTAIYSGLTNAANAAQFIAKLEQTAGVTLPATNTTQPGQPPQFGRQELINLMASGQFTAAQTLRAFIEQKVVFDA
ncbi:MAG TPA: M12 family metallo-peptidase, partial [Pyrinomonadaceae bacterium]|nr:M12 family metallo-peptidase [Pyrinomonadaceae bacterium]